MQTEYELIHYGILGMKWGVRRYQPYGEGGYNPKHKGTNKVRNSETRRKARIKQTRDRRAEDNKNRSIISDKALDEKINRLRKEKQLKDLTDEALHPGRTMAKKLAKGTLGTVLSGATAYGGYILLQKALGTKVKLPKPQVALTPEGVKNVNGGLKRLMGASVSIGKWEKDTPKQIAGILVKGGFKKK